jgi:20S proteasome subunit beta 1
MMQQTGRGATEQDWLGAELKTGTTIMAVEFDGGVVIGADSRTTTGSYVANRVTDKLTRVTDFIYCCRSGSAADTQAIADIVAYHLSVHKMEIGEEPLVMTAAKIFQDVCYNYRDQMSAGIIVAGWDRKLGGQVYMIPIGGMCIRQPFAIGGSGSTYIYGYVDSVFKEQMSEQDCLNFTKNAVTLAIHRDGSSGGVVRLAAISESGIKRDTILHNDLPQFSDL